MDSSCKNLLNIPRSELDKLKLFFPNMEEKVSLCSNKNRLLSAYSLNATTTWQRRSRASQNSDSTALRSQCVSRAKTKLTNIIHKEMRPWADWISISSPSAGEGETLKMNLRPFLRSYLEFKFQIRYLLHLLSWNTLLGTPRLEETLSRRANDRKKKLRRVQARDWVLPLRSDQGLKSKTGLRQKVLIPTKK